MGNFIQDFLSYNVGTECPRDFLRWAALSGISIAAGFRYSLQQGRVRVAPNRYVMFIDKAGTRKSYAIDQIRDMISETFPEHPLGASVMSRDRIIDYLHKDCERAFTNEDGVNGVIYHPMSFFINEFKHFTTYGINVMVSFFVDIYDRPMFDCSTISRSVEMIERPCINVLAAENSEWIITHLKQGLLTGGFSRRFIVLFEPRDEDERIIPEPYLPPNATELWSRMKDHLKAIKEGHARYNWDDQARRLFHEWYEKHKKNLPEDEAIRGFMRSKDQQLLKVVIGLDLAEHNPTYRITCEGIEIGLAMFDVIEGNMARLYTASGRNELALPQQEILELLRHNHGCIEERQLLRITDKNIGPMERFTILKNLQSLGHVFRVLAPNGEWGKEGKYFMLTERYEKERKLGHKFTVLIIGG